MVGWEEDVEADIAAAGAARREVTDQFGRARAAEPALRNQARQVLSEAVSILKRHGVPSQTLYLRHEGKPPKPRPGSGIHQADEGIFINVVSSMMRERRRVYVDASAPSTQGWEMRAWGGRFITEKGDFVFAHSLAVGRYTARGGDRYLDKVPRASCVCSSPELLRLCPGIDARSPHQPHLELDREYEGALIHGEPFDQWLRGQVSALVDGRR